MVEFATLFMFMVMGTHPVEVLVDDSVASVEFLLDGQAFGVVTEEPWRIDCDFGQDPLPHELLAIARDASEREVATVRQLINLPRSSSEVIIVLEGSPGAAPSGARLIIGNPLFVQPEHITVELDGAPLVIGKDHSISFSDVDVASAHVITAEVGFSDGSAAHSAVSFTMGANGVSETQLTAVSIVATGSVDPTLESLLNAFTVKGRAVTIKAIERPGGRVVMVRDLGASEDLWRLGEFRDRRLQHSSRLELWRGALVNEDRYIEESLFRTVEPIPNMIQTNATSLSRTFWVSPPYRIEEAGLDWCATHAFPVPDELAGGHKKQQVADAVAIAGLNAAGSGRPRVVVLVVGDKKPDASLIGTEPIKRFLRAINVPLVVWATDPSAANRWGGAVDVNKPKQLSNAARDVMDLVESQWTVWLEGLHLPGDVSLSAPRSDIRIAAR